MKKQESRLTGAATKWIDKLKSILLLFKYFYTFSRSLVCSTDEETQGGEKSCP